MKNENENGITYFMPFVFSRHNLGNKMGNVVAPLFLSLNEMRKYYPEPQKYVILNLTN